MLGRPFHIFLTIAQAYIFDILLLIFPYKSLYFVIFSSIFLYFPRFFYYFQRLVFSAALYQFQRKSPLLTPLKARRTTRDGRTDPAGPPGTDGRTRKALKNLMFPYFSPLPPLKTFFKGLFNQEFPITPLKGSNKPSSVRRQTPLQVLHPERYHKTRTWRSS